MDPLFTSCTAELQSNVPITVTTAMRSIVNCTCPRGEYVRVQADAEVRLGYSHSECVEKAVAASVRVNTPMNTTVARNVMFRATGVGQR